MTVGEPAAPDWLIGEARDEWKRQSSILREKGLLADEFASALALWCEAFGEYVECVRKLKTTGLTTTTDKGNLLQHPLVAIKNRAFERVRQIGQRFGFTPIDQISLPAAKPETGGIAPRKRE